jgi:hypothetical protein
LQFHTNQVKDIFNCSLQEPLKMKNNQLLAGIFQALKIKGAICENWQNVIDINCMFIGSRKPKTINAIDLSNALSKFGSVSSNAEKSKIITTSIDNLFKV